MNWKTDYRSIYYLGAPEPDDIELKFDETALLVIDVQNTYRARPERGSLSPEEQRRYDLWTPFHRRLDHGKALFRMFDENRVEARADRQNLARLDLDIRRLALGAA